MLVDPEYESRILNVHFLVDTSVLCADDRVHEGKSNAGDRVDRHTFQRVVLAAYIPLSPPDEIFGINGTV